LNLNYTPKAVADLDSIHEYISTDNRNAADQVIARILQAMAVLERFPDIGREGRIKETREWSISGLPYVGIYTKASASDIDIIAIVHTSQKFPPEEV